MKLINFKRIIAFICVMSLLFLSGCNDEVKITIINEYKEDQKFNAQVSGSEKVLISKNSSFKMYLYPETAIVTVEDLYGKVWSTNPLNASDVELPTNLNNAMSQLRLTYLDTQYKSITMDSYSESINKGNSTYYKTENGFGVNYFFGNKSDTYLVPKVMSISSYEKLLSNMDERNAMLFQAFYLYTSLDTYKNNSDSKAVLTEKYPILEKTDVYILQSRVEYELITEDVLKQINDILVSGGYTKEDYEKDCELDLATSSENKSVKFSLAVEYELTDYGLKVTIPKESISYDTSYIVLEEIELLPYFSAADTNEKGYMIVPDLSGAIVELNNGKTELQYSKRVYGNENTVKIDTLEEDNSLVESEIYLPVFAQKDSDDAFLAVIEKGDAYAKINCHTSNEFTKYNQIYPSFVIQSYEENNIEYNGSETVYSAQENPISEELSVSYILINDPNINYSGLAKICREYLTNFGMISNNKTYHSTLGINLIASVKSKKQVLGVPVVYDNPVTTVSQMIDFTKHLKDNDVENYDMNIISWCNGGLSNSVMENVDIINSVGNKKEFKKLFSLNNEFTNVYAGVNFSYYSKSMAKRKYGAENINGLIAEVKNYESGIDTDAYVLNAKYLPQIVTDFIKSFENKFENKFIYDKNTAKVLNANYSDDPTDREEAIKNISLAGEKFKNKGYTLKYCGGNLYALKYADAIDKIPTSSTENYLFDASIPFYQLVVGKSLTYFSEPLNTDDDYEKALLKCIETGTVPTFECFYAENLELINSKENYYSACIDTWKEKMIEAYKTISEINTATEKSALVGHSCIGNNVYESVYDNGCRIIVNYSDTDFNYSGNVINAFNYGIVGE